MPLHMAQMCHVVMSVIAEFLVIFGMQYMVLRFCYKCLHLCPPHLNCHHITLTNVQVLFQQLTTITL